MRHQQITRSPLDESSHTPHWARRVGEYLSLPIILAAAPTLGFLVGWVLDRKLHTFPWLTLLLLVAGFIAGVREVWTAVKRSDKIQKRS